MVQPGLVYVIEWQAFAVSSSPTSDSSSPPLPDMEDHHQEADSDDSTVYVAYVPFHFRSILHYQPHYPSYHDWEHFSSIRNLKGPHVGMPKVKERSASQADVPPSPVAEEYKPAKERKKAEKEREREKKERKREKAREKIKYPSTPNTDKGKQKAEQELLTDTESEGESEEPERDVSPEKLKIKLKLTLNSNSSSANLSESENNSGRSTQQKTGLKLRLPPSRSLSATPSIVSTPPTSQASTTSSTSAASSNVTLPTTSATSTSTSQYHSTASVYPSIAQALPHAHPPTHTSAPHLISDSRDSSPGVPQRTNRSPKRTFDESELEDSHSTTGRVRSRLCGPERDDNRSVELQDVSMAGVNTAEKADATGGVLSGGREGTVERETEEREVAETLVEPPTSRVDEVNNEGYESDTTSSSALSSLEPSLTKEHSGTPTTSPSNSPSLSSHQIHQSDPSPPPDMHSSPTTPIASAQQFQIPKKSQQPNLPGKSAITRRQKREAALGVAAAMAAGGVVTGDSNRPLTRRQRKTLGLPKVRRMAGPYDRTRSGGGMKGKGEEDEGEWKRNGTGRVDVRGFRELRI